MAFMPVAVAVSRTNNIDSLLVFTLLLGAWMLFRGVRSGKLGWVLGAFAMIGLGFNMKMMQAYMVVPAFFSCYMFLLLRHSGKKEAHRSYSSNSADAWCIGIMGCCSRFDSCRGSSLYRQQLNELGFGACFLGIMEFLV
ncbi:hypothetical protein GCM10020331_043370 [Ectobacillus funiculus]